MKTRKMNARMLFQLLTAIAALALVSAQAASGVGFSLVLNVSDGKTRQSVETERQRPAIAPMRRTIVEGSTGSQFTSDWKVTRAAKDTAADVLVHFYVVRLDKTGEAPPPLDPKRVVVESALTMDFPPGETARASMPFRVDGPGVYLIRIEAGSDDFVELEMVVK